MSKKDMDEKEKNVSLEEEKTEQNLEEKETEKNENTEEKNEEVTEESFEEKIGILQAEIETLKQDYLRKQAEFQNYTKRKEKEYDELKKFASEKIVMQLIPEIDNLERAITAALDSKDFDGLNKGVEIILNHLKDILKVEGVEEIKAEGEVDPYYHHAVGVEESEEHKDNEIVKVLQKGYVMKGKVIRPAMVTVCKK